MNIYQQHVDQSLVANSFVFARMCCLHPFRRECTSKQIMCAGSRLSFFFAVDVDRLLPFRFAPFCVFCRILFFFKNVSFMIHSLQYATVTPFVVERIDLVFVSTKAKPNVLSNHAVVNTTPPRLVPLRFVRERPP